jgi:hypothetical protein
MHCGVGFKWLHMYLEDGRASWVRALCHSMRMPALRYAARCA